MNETSAVMTRLYRMARHLALFVWTADWAHSLEYEHLYHTRRWG